MKNVVAHFRRPTTATVDARIERGYTHGPHSIGRNNCRRGGLHAAARSGRLHLPRIGPGFRAWALDLFVDSPWSASRHLRHGAQQHVLGHLQHAVRDFSAPARARERGCAAQIAARRPLGRMVGSSQRRRCGFSLVRFACESQHGRLNLTSSRPPQQPRTVPKMRDRHSKRPTCRQDKQASHGEAPPPDRFASAVRPRGFRS
jgi:hypothetical protein